MFACLAFKVLRGRYPDALFSPTKGTPWEVDPKLRLPVLKAKKGTFEAGHGVYAATVEEAQRYAEDYQAAVYLVAPLPGKHTVVGEYGWRAEGAICLKPLTEENQAQIARTILAAAAYDLPQVPAVLRWAIEVASQAEGRLVCPPKVLVDLLRNNGATALLESLLPYMDKAEAEQALAQRSLTTTRDTGHELRLPFLRWVTLVLSEASGKLVTPKGVQIEKLLDCEDDKEYAAWLGRMARYLSAEQLAYACESLLGASKKELLAEARRVWLERATPPSNIAEGEMNHRRAWEVLALVRAHGASSCPQGLLKAALDFAIQRNDSDLVVQLGLYCNDERLHALRMKLLLSTDSSWLYRGLSGWPEKRDVDRSLGIAI